MQVEETCIQMPMKETMAKLAKVAAQLNTESDSLNELIERFQDQLRNSGAGVSVWLEDEDEHLSWLLEREGDEDSASGWQIGFVKLDGNWCVVARMVEVTIRSDSHRGRFVEEVEPRTESVPLTRAPRSVRVEALPLFDELAEAIVERMEEHLRGILKAKKLIES